MATITRCVRLLANSAHARSHWRLDYACTFFERLMQKPLVHLMGCRIALQPLWVLDWFVTSGCCLHDAQNVLKHSLRPFCPDGLMAAQGMVFLSLRNGYAFICLVVAEFVFKNIEFTAEEFD
jgi:hypothetical protein